MNLDPREVTMYVGCCGSFDSVGIAETKLARYTRALVEVDVSRASRC